jgi:putative ABC transport system permease protein
VLRLLRLISYPQLRASWGRTALVVGGIATGVSLIVAINVINTSVLANVHRTIDLMAGPAALEVTLGVGEIGFQETVIDAVRADPDVLVAVPLVRGTISVADDSNETLHLFGADLTAEEDLRRYQVTVASGRREALRVLEDPDAILLTSDLARRHGVSVGGRIDLSTPAGIRAFRICGLLHTEGLAAALGGQLAVVDIAYAQALLGKEGRLDQIDVILRPDADVASVQRRLQSVVPRTLTVAPPTQRGERYQSILASFQAMLTGLSSLCLIAGVFIVYNTTSTGASHRARAMAWLRLIGADSSRVFRLLMLEALALGMTGAALGLGVGVVLARLLCGVVSDSMGEIFQLRFAASQLAIDLRHQAVIVAVGIGAALFASYFAASRVARLEPLGVIRAEVPAGIDTRVPSRRFVGWWVVLLAVSCAALVVEARLRSVVWGNFGATLWNASVIVIAIPVVAWVGGALTRVLPKLFGAEGQVAAASLLRSATRAGVTTAAIALVLTVGITVSSIVASGRHSITSYVTDFLAADLIVSAVATEGGWLESPLPEQVAADIRAIPGVKSVETYRAMLGQMFRDERIGIAGLSDGFFDPSRYPAGWYHEGDPVHAAEELRAGTGATISTSLSDRFDLHTGDRIELGSPTGPVSFRIVGVVTDYVSERGTVLFSRRVLVDRWQEPTISRISVFTDPGASVDSVRSEITRRLGRMHRLKVLTTRQVYEYQVAHANRAFAFTDTIQLLIAIVTVAGIFDLLLSAILERRRELAVWRLVGADERSVRRSVIIESGTIGALGSALGVGVGFVTAWIWVRINFRHLIGFYLDYYFAVGATAWYIALVMMMTTLAGYAAALRATRADVLEGIRNE